MEFCKLSDDSVLNKKGIIFDIQGHSVHDGPGVRTTVFLNGCPLKCHWCANPEGIPKSPVLLHRHKNCVLCKKCIGNCNKNAISEINNTLCVNRELCNSCTEINCVRDCYFEALLISGKEMSVSDLLKILCRDRQFWGSKGGVTFSGGEPFFQHEFLTQALIECKKLGMHTCIETSAYVRTDLFVNIIKYLDWVFVDIKHMDSNKHYELTGVTNHLIMDNIKYLASESWEGFTVVRIPVVPGYNDDEENIKNTAKFVKKIGLEVINLLPYHSIGKSKYTQLGKEYELEGVKMPTLEHLEKLKRVVESEGVVCLVGSDTLF